MSTAMQGLGSAECFEALNYKVLRCIQAQCDNDFRQRLKAAAQNALPLPLMHACVT